MKKAISLILSILLLMALSIPVCADNPTSFSDVDSSHWAYSAIMDMVGRGLFQGTTEADESGVAEFRPDGEMTRAQFLTVITRILFQPELDTMEEEGETWWSNYYDVAEDQGIIRRGGVFKNRRLPVCRHQQAGNGPLVDQGLSGKWRRGPNSFGFGFSDPGLV